MSEPILSIQNLQVNYGGIEAVKGISFDVPEGEIVTLIGANGAGKSSTLRSISGLVKPRSGKILFKGEDITGKNPTEIVSRGITLVPEGRKIFADLTVKENLRIGLSVMRRPRRCWPLIWRLCARPTPMYWAGSPSQTRSFPIL